MNVEIKAGILSKRDAIKNRITKRKTDICNGITEFKKHPHGIQKKILLSLGLGAGVLATNWAGIPTFVLQESARVQSLLPVSIDGFAALVTSYGINAASFLINLNQQRKLLQNENIEMNQDLSSTVLYHGLGRKEFWKNRPTGRSIAAISAPTIVSAVVTALARESVFITIATVSPERMPQIVIMKSAQGAFNLVQAGAAEIVLRTFGKKKRFENYTQKLLFLNGYDKSGCFLGIERNVSRALAKERLENRTQVLLFRNENCPETPSGGDVLASTPKKRVLFK
jgi:hypothetical protein